MVNVCIVEADRCIHLHQTKEELLRHMLELTKDQRMLIAGERYGDLSQIIEMKQQDIESINRLDREIAQYSCNEELSQEIQRLMQEIQKIEVHNLAVLEETLISLENDIMAARLQKNGYAAYFKNMKNDLGLY